MRIPEGLTDVIGKRLSRLSDECNGVLGVAAVIGRDFSLDVLLRVADIAEEDLFAMLEEAQAAAVIEEQGTVRGVVGFRFAHAFFRQTLYEEAFAPRRIRLHQQVGQALEEVYGTRLEEHASELAEHFSHSSDPAGLEKALRYGEMAAERAMSVYAYSEAVDHLERCVDVHEVLNDGDKAKRCDLLLKLGEALIPAGEPLRAAREAAPEAQALSEKLSDESRTLRACWLAIKGIAAYGTMAVSTADELRPWIEKADVLARPGTTDRFFADRHLSVLLISENRVAESWDLRVGNLEQAQRLDDPSLLRGALFAIFARAWAPHHHEFVATLVKEQMQRAGGPQIDTGVIRHLLVLGERELVEDQWHRLQQEADRRRLPLVLMHARANEAVAATLDGELEDAARITEEILEIGESFGAAAAGAQVSALGVRPLIYLGRFEEALRPIQWLVDVAVWGIHPSTQAMCHAHMGLHDEARGGLRRTMEQGGITAEQDETTEAVLAMLLEAAVLVEDREAAEVFSQRLAALSHLSVFFVVNVCPGRILGSAASLLGKPNEARELYLQGLEASEKLRNRPEIALIRMELAALLLDHYPDERAEALDHLDFAIAELRGMKMQPSLERALSHRELLEA